MLLVTCDTGFEHVLANELIELTNGTIKHISSGRIFIDIPRNSFVNVFRSRIANNIYMLINVFNGITTLEDIYKAVKGLEFTDFIDPQQSFAIRSERIGEHSFTSIDISRVAGQAVIDSYIASKNIRLKVDLDNPDIEIYVELNRDRLLVGFALVRASMHIRRYRLFNHPAALKPTIAASMLRLVKWDPKEGLVDPMCGGGTIVIEAALISKNIEIPCINKQSINMNISRKIMYTIDEELEKLCRAIIERDYHRAHIGIDLNPRFVEGAIINAKNGGVDDAVLFLKGDSIELIPKIKQIEYELGAELSIAVFNPPYGYRMKLAKLSELYKRTLEILRDHRFKRASFITSAIKIAENALTKLSDVSVNRIRVIHGTLPSNVYIVDFK